MTRLNIVGNKPSVHKVAMIGVCPVCHPEGRWQEHPWMVRAPHYCERFDTWREAMDFALAYRPPILMNVPQPLSRCPQTRVEENAWPARTWEP